MRLFLRPLQMVIFSLCVGGLSTLAACAAPTAPAVTIPSVNQFTKAAIGTPVPPRLSNQPVNVPPDKSGVAFFNQKMGIIRVALSDTITTITPTFGFLYILPPGTYNFYVYETDIPPSVRTEQTEAGKARYVYLLPFQMELPDH
jgi:hypothetical protein